MFRDPAAGKASLPWKIGVPAPTPRKPASSTGTGTITAFPSMHSFDTEISWLSDRVPGSSKGTCGGILRSNAATDGYQKRLSVLGLRRISRATKNGATSLGLDDPVAAKRSSR